MSDREIVMEETPEPENSFRLPGKPEFLELVRLFKLSRQQAVSLEGVLREVDCRSADLPRVQGKTKWLATPPFDWIMRIRSTTSVLPAEDFARVHDIVRIQRVLDRPHHVNCALADLVE